MSDQWIGVLWVVVGLALLKFGFVMTGNYEAPLDFDLSASTRQRLFRKAGHSVGFLFLFFGCLALAFVLRIALYDFLQWLFEFLR